MSKSKSTDDTALLLLAKETSKGSADSKRFLNFWGNYCRSNYNLNMIQCTKKAIDLWRSFSETEKKVYSILPRNSKEAKKKGSNNLACDTSLDSEDAEKKIDTKRIIRKPGPRKPTSKSITKVGPRLKLQAGSSCTLKRPNYRNTYRANCYLNFLRSFRTKHSELETEDLIKNAAEAWCNLTKEEKDSYRRNTALAATASSNGP